MEAISRLLGDHSFSEFSLPYAVGVVRKELRKFNSVFPSDFLSLLEHTDGISYRGWSVCGLFGIRNVVTRERNFLIIAERNNSAAIAVEDNTDSTRLVYFEYETGVMRALQAALLFPGIARLSSSL